MCVDKRPKQQRTYPHPCWQGPSAHLYFFFSVFLFSFLALYSLCQLTLLVQMQTKNSHWGCSWWNSPVGCSCNKANTFGVKTAYGHLHENVLAYIVPRVLDQSAMAVWSLKPCITKRFCPRSTAGPLNSPPKYCFRDLFSGSVLIKNKNKLSSTVGSDQWH